MTVLNNCIAQESAGDNIIPYKHLWRHQNLGLGEDDRQQAIHEKHFKSEILKREKRHEKATQSGPLLLTWIDLNPSMDK